MSQLEQLESRLEEVRERLYRSADSEHVPVKTTLDERLALLRRRVRRSFNRTVRKPVPRDAMSPAPPIEAIQQSLEEHWEELPPVLEDKEEASIQLADRAIDNGELATEPPSNPKTLVPVREEAEQLPSKVSDHVSALDVREREFSALIERIRALHVSCVRGTPPRFEILRDLAYDVIEMQFGEPPLAVDLQPLDPVSRVAGHCLNVAGIVSMLTEKEIRWQAFRLSMVIAALVQDAGLLHVDPHGEVRLAEPEREQGHPLLGAMILENYPQMEPAIIQATAAHHERLDSCGYPRGLAGDQLDMPARLLAVANQYCMLQKPDLNDKPMTPRGALLEMLRQAEAGAWDLQVTQKLLNFGLYPVGSYVELSTGELGEVIATQEAADAPPLAALPIVRLICLRDRRPLKKKVYRNLAQWPDCRVVRLVSAVEASQLQ